MKLMVVWIILLYQLYLIGTIDELYENANLCEKKSKSRMAVKFR